MYTIVRICRIHWTVTISHVIHWLALFTLCTCDSRAANFTQWRIISDRSFRSFGSIPLTFVCRTRDVLKCHGYPKETTRRQDRAIRLAHLRDRFRTAVETAANTPGRHSNIHPKTVRNRLKDVGLYARRPYVGRHLTQIRRQNRMKWLRRHSLSSVSYAPMETSPV